MKNIVFAFLLFSSAIFAQTFDKKWNKVIAFENEGKVKSASEIVSEIYKKAVSEKDEVQMIKCFFYQSKYLQVVAENAQTKILNNLRRDIDQVSIPSKSILNLVYAKCLNDYFNRNNYQIKSRTNTISLEDDFLTWTEINFTDKISTALKKSLENEAVLKNTPLTKYESIFDYPTLEKFKNLNLLDYLIAESIAIYSAKIHYWEVQKSDFIIHKKELLGKSSDFIKLNLDFITNENLKLTLKLYQKQEINNPNPENLWQRIQFSKQHLIDPDHDYLQALNRLQKNTSDIFLIQKIQLEKASFLEKNASKTVHSDYNFRAIVTLDSILNVDNKSNTYKLALSKKENILSKSLHIQLQKNSYTNENTRAFVRYKNMNGLIVSFFKINQNEVSKFRKPPYPKDNLVDSIMKKQKPASIKKYELLNKNDYLEYTTEVLLPNLEIGSYLVYFESDTNKKAFAFETINVTNLAVLVSQNDKADTYQILDRKTGKPLENVSVKSQSQNLLTDKNGIAVGEKTNYNYNHNYNIEVSSLNDSLSVRKDYSNHVYQYLVENSEYVKLKGKVELYLDRAIYRPGQTVYYKGIAFQKLNNKASVVANTTFKILIKNTNQNVIKEFDVVTNEFGSFSGEFGLPKNGLTGNFNIEAKKPKDYENDINYDKNKEEHPFWDNVNFENSRTNFKVEEYKRPKFEVVFEPKKETYQVNQTVKVKGTAKAFAGSNISDAIVKYTVIRYTQYYRSFYGQEETEILTIAETKTDASGKFSIDFNATPSKNSKKEQLPIFNYRINATVTDINGETHDAETTVKVGYHDLILGASLPDQIETKNINEITLTSTNLNGEIIATKGEIKMYFVSPFSNTIKGRVFPQPDIESIPHKEFERLFPYENNENSNEKEIEEILLFSKKIDTEKDKKIVLNFISNYKSGHYRIVFSAKDNFNNEIKSSKEFKILQSNDKYNPAKLITSQQINADPKKDGFVLVKITSSVPELYINTTGNYQSKLYFETINHLQNNEVTFKIPIKEEFEEKLKIGFQTVFENQTFNDEIEIPLKKEEKKLVLNVKSFRNKIEPGSKENWSFQLESANTKNEAEILASMYDSSLDQFSKKNWNNLAFNTYNYNSAFFKNTLGFDKINSYLKDLNPVFKKVELTNEESAKLMWFGFDFNSTSQSLYQQREYQKQLNKKAKKPANAKMISGIITDDYKVPLSGASISVKGTQRSTISDYNGYYEIEAAKGEELIFSFIGLKIQSLLIQNKKTSNIVLVGDPNTLREVVVVGYGTQKKSDLAGAVMKLKNVGSESIQEDNNVYNTAGIDPRFAKPDFDNSKDSLNPEYYFKTSKVKFIPGKKIISGLTSMVIDESILYIIDGKIADVEEFKKLNPANILDMSVVKDEEAKAIYGVKGEHGVVIVTTKKALEALTQVKARKNLSETAFFLPNLKTDSKGKVSFNFTSPEALTAWKLRLLAHNKDAVSGYLEKSVITQKELMVMPNFPRFFREKDTIVISAKISNVTAEAKTGMAILQFFDATTMQPIDAKMLNAKNSRNFTVGAFGNTTANWTISIPEGLQGVQYRIIAKSGNFSDGEENILPVLTNNMLVTESIPVWVRENSTKDYTFENLKNNTSTTLRNHQFTLEYTSNPTWLAIQSLPYLMEYEHECAEQTFARFYANALASEIISSNPKIAAIFEEWRKNGKLNSKLEENEELKSIILAETPWLNDAKSEDEKKKNLALLFDLEKMETSQEATFEKLKKKQNNSGGFPWFEGGHESEYITRHILAALGHLSKLSKNEKNAPKINEIAKTGIPYLDQKFLEHHKTRTRNLKKGDIFLWFNPYSDLHYLFTRSFYLEQYPLSDTLKKATKLYLETAKKEWLNYSIYEKGLASLTLNRFGEKESAKKILESLKETSSNNEDWGMYWIANKAGWWWYQAPIETQALLIEAFAEVNQDTKSVDAMKVWLLKNKQTKNWPTTKSTTEAIYALLMQGTDWLSVKDNTVIKIGDEKIVTKKLAENEKEAATGYIKMNWKAEEVKKEMASIKIENKSKVPGFGGVYWQYFEDLDKIKNNSGAVLSVLKDLYLKKNTLKGNELEKITSENALKIGDLVTVRLIISAKEDTEYIHLKDMRASCFEPVNVMSEYQYKDRLDYYMSTKDAATHFFFNRIDKGTYVIEYDIRVNNSGEFSNGITTIQSMYAPEFASHTKGIRVKVN